MKSINTLLAFAWLFVLSLTASAQTKNFTYAQLFENRIPPVSQPLPQIGGWADAERYIEIQRQPDGNGKPVLLSVDARTGKAVPYVKPPGKAEITASSLHGAAENMKNLTSSPDGKWMAYTKHNDLYTFELSTGLETQITHDGSDTILNGYASWVYYEEILGRSSNYKAYWWSPDSKHIAYMRFDDSNVPVFPIYIATGQHGYLEKQRYPKAGDKNPEVKIGIVSVDNPQTVWADFNSSNDQYFGTPVWSPGGQLWVSWMNRSQDSLVIYQVNKSSGDKKQVYLERQRTWIELDKPERIVFLESGKGFLVQSDKDGWENLYLYDMDGRFLNRVSTGNYWNVSVLAVDEKAKQVYIKARKDHSARFDIYKLSLNGKEQTKISFGEYSHDQVWISPGGKYFISAYSNLSTPPAMALADQKGKIIRALGSSKGPEFDQYALPRTSLMTVKSSDGIFDLPLTVTYPLNFNPQKKYPVFISIYGGPNAGRVFDRWRPVSAIPQWLAQEGVIQVEMDHRSSGHFGKTGMNYIFRQLGKWEMEDYMTIGRWLRSQPWTDTTKLAINGGSFGGYMTCMALTYGADVFTHGIAYYSVTSWELYDSHYTERFMRTPLDNPEGYKITSPISYARNYKGLLRIVHGSADDNVHLQNSIQLIDTLENLGKHFELMIYPGARHGVTGEKAFHNRKETLRFIYENLLEEELPSELSR